MVQRVMLPLPSSTRITTSKGWLRMSRVRTESGLGRWVMVPAGGNSSQSSEVTTWSRKSGSRASQLSPLAMMSWRPGQVRATPTVSLRVTVKLQLLVFPLPSSEVTVTVKVVSVPMTRLSGLGVWVRRMSARARQLSSTVTEPV